MVRHQRRLLRSLHFWYTYWVSKIVQCLRARSCIKCKLLIQITSTNTEDLLFTLEIFHDFAAFTITFNATALVSLKHLLSVWGFVEVI